MTTDKNKVSELLVSDKRIQNECPYGPNSSNNDLDWMDGARRIRDIYEAELARLRQERDGLVGALLRITDRASEIGQPAVDAMDGEDFHLLADAISMSREVLAKHKPE